MERAEAVMDQLQIKRGQSLGRAKNIKERASEWKDVNGKARKVKDLSCFAVLRDPAADLDLGGGGDDEWEDEEAISEDAAQEKEAIEAVTALNVSTGSGAVGASVPATAAEDDVEVL